MVEDIERYYLDQVGSGIAGYKGVRYQKGSGFFSRIFSSAIYPLMKYFGKKALRTGINIASDVFHKDQHWKDSLRERGKQAGAEVLDDGYQKAMQKLQRGRGRRRKPKKRKTKKRKVKKIKKVKRKCGRKAKHLW
jgi:hypothetical protein